MLPEYRQFRRKSGGKNSKTEKQISNALECRANRSQPHTQDNGNDQKFAANLYFRNITLELAEWRMSEKQRTQ